MIGCIKCQVYNHLCHNCVLMNRAGRHKSSNDYAGSATSHMYARNAVKFGDIPEELIDRMQTNPEFSREVLARIRREARGYHGRIGISATSAAGEPMLIARKGSVQVFRGAVGARKAKDKLIKSILVKPESGKAAKIAGSWASHEWKVYSLKYSPGLVILNHRGEESDVFPGWAKMKAILTEIGFKIIR